MWKWTCPKNPLSVNEHHSWRSLNEHLTSHEDGFKVPGFREFPPCEAVHDYWDDGLPCDFQKVSGKRCQWRYVRDDEPEWSKNYVD